MSRLDVVVRAVAGIALGLGLLIAVDAPAQADSARAYVKGRVVDAEGRPAGAMHVALVWCRQPGHTQPKKFGCTGKTAPRYTAAVSGTDPDGRYVIPLRKSRIHSSSAGWRYYVVANDGGLLRHDPSEPRDNSTVFASSGRIKAPRIGHDVAAPNIDLPSDTDWTAPSAAWTAPSNLTAMWGFVIASDGAPIVGWGTGGGGPHSNDWNGYYATRDGSGTSVHLAIDACGYEPVIEDVAVPATGRVRRDVTLTADPIVTGRVEVPTAGRGWRAHVNVIDSSTGEVIAKAPTDARGHFRATLFDCQSLYATNGPFTVEVRARRYHPSTRLTWTSPAPMTFKRETTTNIGTLRVHRP